LTQKQLAKAAGICVRYVRTIERITDNHGERQGLAQRVIKRYAKAVGLPETDWPTLLIDEDLARVGYRPANTETAEPAHVDSSGAAAAKHLKRAKPGIRSLVSSSPIPMYFMDNQLRPILANEPFLALIGATNRELHEKPIEKVLYEFSLSRVPLNHREAVERHQLRLKEDLLGDYNYRRTAVLLDNRDLEHPNLPGLWLSWVHAQKVRVHTGAPYVGIFVLFHVEGLSEESFARLEALPYEVFRERALESLKWPRSRTCFLCDSQPEP
jgi:hypothetical protein